MFNDCYRNKKVLVTGNTGFKGAWLSIWLKHLGAEVFGYSSDIPTNPSIFEVCCLESQLKHSFGDVRDLNKLKELVETIKPDFVFHLAAQPIVSASYVDPIDTFTSNIIGTANLLEVCRNASNPMNVIVITSDKCYENVEWGWGYRENDRLGGKDPYSASKGAAELIFHSYFHSFFKNSDRVKLVSVRAGNVIGGGDWALNRIVPDAMRSWSQGKEVVIRSPRATRPWQHVLEPLSGYLTAGMKLSTDGSIHGESYNFGPNADQNHSVLELLEKLAQSWGAGDAAKMIAIEDANFHEAGLLKLNCDKALNDLLWRPTLNFEQTIKFTSDWYVSFYESNKMPISYIVNQIEQYTAIAREKSIKWSSM